MSAPKLVIILAFLVIAVVVGWLVVGKNFVKSSVQLTNTQNLNSTLTSPEPSPVKVDKLTGQITSIKGTDLTINVDSQPRTVSLTGVLSFQKILSGSIAQGNASIASAELKDLKVGQTVLITFDQQSNKPRTVFILK